MKIKDSSQTEKKPDIVGHKHIVHLVLKMSLIGWIPPLLILAWPHTFVAIDYGQVFPSAESFKKGCCQLQAKVCKLSSG